ncbi:MAG: hypothetical protein JXB60_01775, partial [Candidatus Cloacimonetes bacterium]|nr:hypothetical protein [Candidatus Cloacimonadota bacterium]
MIKRIIFGLTQYLYNRRISDHYLRLKQSESWELDELRHYQLLSFRKLLSWTYRESPFYREFYESRKIRPAAITSLEKMKQLPVVTKDMLRVNRERIQIRRGFRKLYFTETSGTTGQSLVFYRDQ